MQQNFGWTGWKHQPCVLKDPCCKYAVLYLPLLNLEAGNSGRWDDSRDVILEVFRTGIHKLSTLLGKNLYQLVAKSISAWKRWTWLLQIKNSEEEEEGEAQGSPVWDITCSWEVEQFFPRDRECLYVVLPKGKDLALCLHLHFCFTHAWEHSELWSKVNFHVVLEPLV